MDKYNRYRFIPYGLAALLLALISTWSHAMDASKFGSKLQNVEMQLNKITKQLSDTRGMYKSVYNEPVKERAYRRMNDGQVLFLTKDYLSASILFFEIIEDPKLAKHLSREDVLYHLAESLHQIKNNLSARKYFKKLIKTGSPKYFQTAMARLVELSLDLNKYEDFEKYYRQLFKSVPADKIEPHIPYLYAKSPYRQRKYKKALKYFSNINANNIFFFQSRYFIGTILVHLGDIKKAIKSYEAIKSYNAQTENQKYIRELAKLALGRLHYEQGDFYKALNEYQNIRKESEFFSEFLFETAWAYIQLKNYDKALHTLDMLVMTDAKGINTLEALSLRGDLLMKMKRYDEASEQYSELLAKYGKDKKQLEALIRKRGQRKKYFDELMKYDKKKFDAAGILPPLVLKMAEAETNIEMTYALIQELRSSKKYIDESIRVIEKLNVAMNVGNNVDIFPRLKQGRAQGVELEHKLIELQDRLNTIEEEVLSAMPKSAMTQKREHRDKYIDVFNGIDKDAPQLKFVLEDLGKRFQELKKKRSRMEKKVNNPELRNYIKTEMIKEERNLSQLESEYNKVMKEVNKERTKLGLKLIEMRDNKSSDRLKTSDLARLKTVKGERKRLQKLFNALPKNSTGFKRRSKKMSSKIGNLEKTCVKLKYHIDGMKAQMGAVKKWMIEVGDQTEDRKAYNRLGKNIARGEKEIKRLDTDYSKLFSEVQKEKTLLGIGGATLTHEDQIRLQFKEALTEERTIYKKIRKKLDIRASGLMDSIERLRTKERRLSKDVRGFYASLEKMVGNKIKYYKKELGTQKRALASYQRNIDKIENRAANIVGEVASNSFKQVNEKLDHIILKANLGLIDVAWQEKKNIAEKYKKLSIKEGSTLQVFDGEFGEILKELE